MAESEASIKIKIKQEGQQTLKDIDQSFSDMIDTAKKAGIALVAVGAAMGKMALDAAKFDDVKKAFTSLTAQQGQDAKTMLQNMKELTAGTVSEVELMKKANMAMILGLPIDKFDDMIAIAKGAAKSAGQSMEFMLDSMVVGLGRQSKMVLDNLGIIVNIDKAYQDFAASIGTTAEKLTDAQKKQVFINEAMKVGMENLQKMGGLQESTTDKWDRLKASVENASASLGKIFRPTVDEVLKSLNQLVTTISFGGDSEFLSKPFQILTHVINDVTAGFSAVIDYAKALPDIFASLTPIMDAIVKLNRLDLEGAKESMAQSKQIFSKGLDELDARRKASNADWLKDSKAIDDAYNSSSIEKTKETAGIKKKIETEAKKTAIDEAYQYDAEKGDAEGWRKLRALESFADNERAIAERTSSEAIAIREAEEAAKLQIAKDAEEQLRLARIDGGKAIEGFAKQGLEGFAKNALTALTERFLPGFGQAAGQVFSVLAQDSESFKQGLDQMFSVDFINNFANNLGILSESLPGIIENLTKALTENAPDIMKGLIEGIIANAPEIASALTKSFIAMFMDAKFMASLAEAIVNGIVAGIKDVMKDISEEIKNSGGLVFEKLQEGAFLLRDTIAVSFVAAAAALQEPIMQVIDQLRSVFVQQITDIKNSWAPLIKDFKDNVDPVINDFKNTTNELVNGIKTETNELLGAMKQSIESLANVLTEKINAIGQPLEAIFLKFKAQIEEMSRLLVTELQNAKEGLVEFGTLFSDAVKSLVDNFGKGVEDLIKSVEEFGKPFADALTKVNEGFEKFAAKFEKIGRIMEHLAEALESVGVGVGNISGGGGGGSGGGGGFLGSGGGGGFLGSAKKALGFQHGNMFDAEIPKFAAGGVVDNTLALVTPGEGIINKDSTAANAGLLSAINQSNGRAVSGGNTININVNGGLLGDDSTARQFARAIDEQLYKLRLGRESRAFDEGLT